jgi:hypothetical protein
LIEQYEAHKKVEAKNLELKLKRDPSEARQKLQAKEDQSADYLEDLEAKVGS